MLEYIDSDPPLRITAFPAFRQSPEASEVTLGLDSYMIPITPRGILIFPTLRPFGLFHIFTTSPTGSFNSDTSSKLVAIESIRKLFNTSLSIIDLEIPLPLA